MDEPFVIKSVTGSGRLELTNPEPVNSRRPVEYFLATLEVEALKASCRVYLPDFCAGPDTLMQLFDDLAANWRGWPGAKGWESLEGEINISCTYNKLGNISIVIALRSVDMPLDWKASGSLVVEAGQLEPIARSARRFLRT